ncbi:hypothetical protein D3C86_1271760 [compost metagenome]
MQPDASESVAGSVFSNDVYLEVQIRNSNIWNRENATVCNTLLPDLYQIRTGLAYREDRTALISYQNSTCVLIDQLELISRRHIGDRNLSCCVTSNILYNILRIQKVSVDIEIISVETAVLVIDDHTVLSCKRHIEISSSSELIPSTGKIFIRTVINTNCWTAGLIQFFPDDAHGICNIGLYKTAVVQSA